MTRLDQVLESLRRITDTQYRVWRADGAELAPVGDREPSWRLPVPGRAGRQSTPDGESWFAPLPVPQDHWLEIIGLPAESRPGRVRAILSLVEFVLGPERETARLSQELASRYEEIDLLYTISEILGRTVNLEEAARTIVHEVSSIVGAKRASIMVYDEALEALRTVAALGFEEGRDTVVPIGDATSIAARVFREHRSLVGGAAPDHVDGIRGGVRGYLGESFMSIPISYAGSGAPARCVGVINLTDHARGDRFTPGDQKLVAAIANQIGAAIENVRLVDLDRAQERLRQELALAHDLQLKLLPDPSVLQDDAEVAVRCLSAESVGGDFYTFARLGQGCVGVMLGDVSSHGLSAALMMAQVLAAAGIHAAASVTPDETLTALRESLASKLSSTEMYLTVFYGILDPINRHLTYANAGHAHAFRIGTDGSQRLDTTAPPLGLGAPGPFASRQVPWKAGEDLLCLWTDGLVDGRNGAGECFGEPRLIAAIVERRSAHPEQIIASIMALAAEFDGEPADDRTLLVLRL